MGRIIIATLLSATIFSLLFYILNNKICGVFKGIQRDLSKLNKWTRHILKISGFILAILMSVYLRIRLNFDEISQGLILGFLGSMVDICFNNNILEKSINK